MKTLQAPTEDFIKREKTKIGADVDSGSSVAITVENEDGFEADDYIVIGRFGTETAELQQITSVSDETLTVGTLDMNHEEGEPVTMIRYNQRKFYGATSKDGSYTELTSDGSPIDIQVDDPNGALIEYTGPEGYSFFKATYYNSQEDLETSLSDATAVEADETKRYTSIYRIRKKAGITENEFISDAYIEGIRQDSENEVDSYLAKRFTLPLSEVPNTIRSITTTLAAGYIHDEEIGEEGYGSKWLKEARSQLKALRDGRMELIGGDGAEVEGTTRYGQVSSYPDSSTDGTAEDRKFTMDQEF